MSDVKIDEKDNKAGNKDKPAEAKTLKVKVVTTSGTYPDQGFEEVKEKEKVSKFLKEAQKHLHLTDVTNWVATVGGNAVDPEKSFQENHLTGKVEIDWGPHEGGGG